MALKYGDVVVKVQRIPGKDGTATISRVNAIVLGSALKHALSNDRKPLTDAAGQKLAPVEHIDIAFPDPGLVPDGQALKTRNVDSIFRLAYDVKPYEEGAAIGFELGPTEENIEGVCQALEASRAASAEYASTVEQLRADNAELVAKLATIPIAGTIGEGAQAAPVQEAEDKGGSPITDTDQD